MAATQTSLFAPHHILPKGFDHKDEVLSPDRERVLVKQFAQLPFKEFEFQGFLGRRRVVSAGAMTLVCESFGRLMRFPIFSFTSE
jgi:hypothetical protein